MLYVTEPPTNTVDYHAHLRAQTFSTLVYQYFASKNSTIGGSACDIVIVLLRG